MCDAVPTLSPEQLRPLLTGFIEPCRVLSRPIERIAHAADASSYRLIPRAVVMAAGDAEIVNLLRFSREQRIPLTFRAAGTSLCGQAVTDGILVDLSRHWGRFEVEEAGRRVRVQPGAGGWQVNAALAAYGTRIGPDPASMAAARMGGILANNSSGMCCGVEQNAYHTLHSIRFLLPSGTEVDTGRADADEVFRAREPELAAGLAGLRVRIDSNPALRERIRSKYRTKNTTGYSLNAFLDFERPVDIFAHLLIGSEGTLGFISEAVLHAVPELPVKYTGLLLYPDLFAASDSVPALRGAGAKALEIMDRAALRSVEDQPGVPPSLRALSAGAAGLLVEFQAAEASERAALEAAAREALSGLKLIEPARFTHSAAEQAALWRVRAGMFPSVGSVRRSGTTVIIEDVAFPLEALASAAVDLRRLFVKHDYDSAIIFGHAKDGNLHFVITQSFNDQKAIDQYARLIDDVVELVVHRYDGALKAEHGTGRNMAPFVETEWGPEAYVIMQQVKRLADPDNLLNPGVIINPDRRAHLANLKPMPAVEAEVDKCIECGYCEPKCPSRELTTSPRQRIVIRREMAGLAATGADPALLGELERAFPYDVLDTCAADGLCATACPVSIDAGALTKRLRQLRHTPSGNRLALGIARHVSAVESAVRAGLRLGHMAQAVIGARGMKAITAGLGLPAWDAGMPHAVRGGVPATVLDGAAAIYFPSCISRVMGRLPGEADDLSLMQAFVEVARRAGKPLHIPDGVEGHCCGTPFSSKGFQEAHAGSVNRTVASFWEWSDHGRLPVIVDTTPCTYGLLKSCGVLTEANRERFRHLQILDGLDFVHDHLLAGLTIRRRAASVVLHPVCSAVKLDLPPKLIAIAEACSGEALVPPEAGCCGFAGDRGFLVPELTAAATRHEAAGATAARHDGYYSSSRTCEIGMTRATGEVYRSYIYLLEWATRE